MSTARGTSVSTFAIVGAALLAITAGTVAAQEQGRRELLGDDVAALQGIWEFRQRQADGEYRIVKELSGVRESFRVYRGTELVVEHSANFEVAREGPVKVFRWKNGKRLFGPGAGTDIPDGGYVYRLNGDVWACFFGALEDDPETPRTMTFRRVPPGESQAPADGN